ncbi:MAG: CinA family nicotinamide mononucleotide deamidase-related protein [Pyrinomonadaceae bacterium]|nr:CinA family nicotinamide mononucleotide deamidase-related protein [Phycisphaerales bacterium]
MPPSHTHAAIVSIGDELTLGQSLDTNSKWLADRLMSLGITTIEHMTIGDDQAQTAETFRRLARTAPLILTTGGLGPTLDDLTRQALADVLGETLIIDDDAMQTLRARFAARGRTLSEIQRIQAHRPPSASMIPNSNGTAPGLQATIRVGVMATGAENNHGASDIFCLPGPPGEMKPMFENHVLPRLRAESGMTVMTRFIHLAGIGEGDAAAKLGSLMDRARNPLVGITASLGVLTCRVRYQGPLAASEAAGQMDETDRLIRSMLGAHVFADGPATLVGSLLALLKTRDEKLVTVESCTGGMLGEFITDVPGASAVYEGGFVTYSNSLKSELAGVAKEIIESHGAVSEQTARAMSLGGLARLGANHCLAITGVAGPEGGTQSKPVGTVFIGLASRREEQVGAQIVQVRRFLINGTRDDIRRRAAMAALTMLLFWLRDGETGGEKFKLLWET